MMLFQKIANIEQKIRNKAQDLNLIPVSHATLLGLNERISIETAIYTNLITLIKFYYVIYSKVGCLIRTVINL